VPIILLTPSPHDALRSRNRLRAFPRSLGENSTRFINVRAATAAPVSSARERFMHAPP